MLYVRFDGLPGSDSCRLVDVVDQDGEEQGPGSGVEWGEQFGCPALGPFELAKTGGIPVPPPAVAVALAAVAVHAREAVGPGGHRFDVVAIDGALQTPGVSEYLAVLEAKALLPLPRAIEEPREAATPPADAAGGPGSRVERLGGGA